MLSPYKGAALETYEKMKGNLRSYQPNKLYKNYGKYFYINSKGFLHVYFIKPVKYKEHKLYYIADLMLTKSNELKEASASKYFNTPEAAAEYFKEFYIE